MIIEIRVLFVGYRVLGILYRIIIKFFKIVFFNKDNIFSSKYEGKLGVNNIGFYF